MFRTLRNGFAMAKASYSIVASHPSLVIFPVLSTLAGALILGSFFFAVVETGVLERQDAGVAPHEDPVLLAETFAFYFASYFTVVFFNVGLVHCTGRALDGKPVSVGGGLRAALGHLPAILGWSLLSACIGVALRWLERAYPKMGAIVAALIGLGWTAITFFVVPILVVERRGALSAVKRSGQVLRKSWGEALLGDFSIAWIGTLIALPGLLLGLLVAFTPGLGELAVPLGLAIAGASVLVSAAASSAADTIFKLLLYRQATRREIPDGLDLGVPTLPAR